jgi:hypothetical protein
MNFEVEIKRVSDSCGSQYYDLYINGKLRFCTEVFMDAVKRSEEIREEIHNANSC